MYEIHLTLCWQKILNNQGDYFLPSSTNNFSFTWEATGLHSAIGGNPALETEPQDTLEVCDKWIEGPSAFQGPMKCILLWIKTICFLAEKL